MSQISSSPTDSRIVALSTFDLGVAAFILSLEPMTNPFSERERDSERYKSRREREREEYHLWADACPKVLARVECAASALGIPKWMAMATCADAKGGTLAPHFGREASDYFTLGRRVWYVGLSPGARGYLEELQASLSQLRLPSEMQDIVSKWLSDLDRRRAGEPHEVNALVEKFRAALEKFLNKLQYNIFISYTDSDIDLVKEISKDLEDKGCSCYIAKRDIPSGEMWSSHIRDTLIGADELLAIVTPNSIKSPWLMVESGIAWAMNKVLNIAYCFIDLKELPEIFTRHQAVNIETNAGKRRLVNEIVERLKHSRMS